MFEKLGPEILRQHKGISFTGITTVFFCHDGNGKIFLTKRSKNTRDEHGRWDPGAGGLKHGQSLEENVKREIKEEYNAIALDTVFLGYNDSFRLNENQQKTHWLAMYFVVKVNPKKVKIMEPENVDDFGWFKIDELPSPTHSQMNVFMKKYGENLKKLIGA